VKQEPNSRGAANLLVAPRKRKKSNGDVGRGTGSKPFAITTDAKLFLLSLLPHKKAKREGKKEKKKKKKRRILRLNGHEGLRVSLQRLTHRLRETEREKEHMRKKRKGEERREVEVRTKLKKGVTQCAIACTLRNTKPAEKKKKKR